MNTWFSVEDRLPMDYCGVYVIVENDGEREKPIRQAYWDGDGCWLESVDDTIAEPRRVTHWLEVVIPPAPPAVTP